MLVLKKLETKHISGGKFVIDPNTTAPVAAGFVAGAFSAANLAEFGITDFDTATVVAYAAVDAIEMGAFTLEEFQEGLASVSWV